ncbi:hypothetical protein JXQ70_06590 [bacterium]|nr:hypothetical protein [bacterium]
MIKDKICYLDTLYIVVNEKKNKFDVDFLRQHCGYGDDESVIVDDYPWGHTDKKTGEWIVDLKWPTMFKVQQPRRPVLEYFLDWSEGFAGDIVLPGLISLWTL